jgi:hypothetical protein
MDLNDLKKTWEKLDSGKELDENQIRLMLEKRTGNMLERIDRNIKIGIFVLFILVIVFAIDDFLLSPSLLKGISSEVAIPVWVITFGVISNLLILLTFVFFVFKYYRVKRSCESDCDLEETLVKIINILNIYKRLFYLALITLLVAISTTFITGLYTAVSTNAREQGMLLSEIPADAVLQTILIGIGFLIFTAGGIFLLLRWGFNRLYGSYIYKLKMNLEELREIEE